MIGIRCNIRTKTHITVFWSNIHRTILGNFGQRSNIENKIGGNFAFRKTIQNWILTIISTPDALYHEGNVQETTEVYS